MEPPPPPQYSHSSSSSTSFPILAISILGILATAILLLSYYLFVINCCLNWRLRRSPSLLRPRLAHPSPRAAAPGLGDSAIRSIPTLRYSSRARPKPVECAVCLAEFRQQELLRVLPGCAHSFHIDCIDTWLQSSPNCPLCRFDISRLPVPFPAAAAAVVVELAADCATPTRTTSSSSKKKKKPPRNFWQAASMGDECIDIGRDEDESFAVAQPIRRSFSMDSSNDRALLRSVQETLQRRGEGGSGGAGAGNACGRIRRSLFSFGRSSRSATAVLPVHSEELL